MQKNNKRSALTFLNGKHNDLIFFLEFFDAEIKLNLIKITSLWTG